MLLGAAAQSELPLPAEGANDFVFSDDDQGPLVPEDLISDSPSRHPQRKSAQGARKKRTAKDDEFVASDGEADARSLGSADGDGSDSSAPGRGEGAQGGESGSGSKSGLSSSASSGSDAEGVRSEPGGP